MIRLLALLLLAACTAHPTRECETAISAAEETAFGMRVLATECLE